jgi:hypothetical membrane protein
MSNLSSLSSRPQARNLQILSWLSAGSVIYFTVAVVLLHLLSPDFDPRSRFISEYVHSGHGYLLSSGFLALGIGSILLVWVLLRLESRHAIGWKVGLVLLAIWGIAVFMDGVFPIDAGVAPVSSSGQIHMIAAMVAFLSLMIASLILSLGFRKKAHLQKLARPALVLVALIYLSFILTNLPDPSIQGLTQRLFVLFCLAWLLLVALVTGASGAQSR